MKIILAIILIIFLSSSCRQFKKMPVISEASFLKMHFIIERSLTDSVKYHLDEFIQNNNLPTNAYDLKPGNYMGESPLDDYGYKHVISFKVEHDRFSDIKYDESKENGHNKTSDTSYCRIMNQSYAGSAPDISYPNYIRQLESKQDLKKIDAVTGATYSKFRFQYAAIRAIINGPIKK
jgi:major membrane immunogen (membrane-anchored lipoprotein)